MVIFQPKNNDIFSYLPLLLQHQFSLSVFFLLFYCVFAQIKRAGAEAEWKILYSLGKDKDGLLHMDVARSVYDGTLFHRLAPDWKSPEREKLSVIREN
jgi:hypothetical protein